MLHSATLEFKLQTPNSPAFTLHKITSETPNKNLKACFTYLHDLSKYVSKLKTNLCTERKMPQWKGDPVKKFKLPQ
jgi:hypothetical protein